VLACRPVVATVAFAVGEIVVGTDAGEWFAGTEGVLAALPATGPFSAAIEAAMGVVVASWEPKRHVLDGRAWTVIDLASPALALASHSKGLVIADVDGGLSLLAAGTRVPVQELSAPSPIVDLAPLGGGLVALAANGALDATTWPGEAGPWIPIDTTTIGRPHAVFAIDQGVLVAGARGVAVVNGSRLAAVTTDLPERIRGAAAFTGRGRTCLYDDAGAGWIVDVTLGHTARVRLRESTLVGVAAGTDVLLAWTSDGALHAIHPDGSASRLAAREVALALPEPGRPTHGIAVHQNAAGVRVTRGHVAWT
jgi:hypothetical protein